MTHHTNEVRRIVAHFHNLMPDQESERRLYPFGRETRIFIAGDQQPMNTPISYSVIGDAQWSYSLFDHLCSHRAVEAEFGRLLVNGQRVRAEKYLALWRAAERESLSIEQLVAAGITPVQYLLSDLTADDVGHDGAPPDDGGITLAQLHWFQASGRWPGGGAFFLHPALRREMQAWRFPLHFIDFETATVAIPFHEGSRPYETVAFQFSHHVLEADGSARHASQFLHAEPGENPNLHFIRALKASLSHDDGTVFRWHNHENTVLNQIVDMLEAQRSTISDADELIAFALTLIERGDGESRQVGPRAMVDLCALSQKYFYHPLTKGSPSLKKVLPALMSCSERLKQIYSRPTYGQCGEIPSLNFSEPIAWWREDANGVADPYKLLPAVTADAAPGSVLHSLRDGGAAMAAYVRLQFENVQASEREAVKSALLRYCELDTLAMLMAVQAWSAWLPS